SRTRLRSSTPGLRFAGLPIERLDQERASPSFARPNDGNARIAPGRVASDGTRTGCTAPAPKLPATTSLRKPRRSPATTLQQQPIDKECRQTDELRRTANRRSTTNRRAMKPHTGSIDGNRLPAEPHPRTLVR